ncbi:MAG TPA: MBL fold metallo-hydrolase, partial [Clostridiaceae bacterium]|nr:MBL fold metallo-hydrolase [Clostridiaceae bacterium]
FIIDPGGDAPEIIKLIKENSIKANFIILTHGHFDHTGGVNYIRNLLKIPVLMNKKDFKFVSGAFKTLPYLPESDIITVDGFVKEEDIIQFGNEWASIIETPGHTPGGISIKIQNCIFSGDTLFKDSIGRSDFPGGSSEDMINSLENKLFIYPDETVVYPGHGMKTTIGNEKKNFYQLNTFED